MPKIGAGHAKAMGRLGLKELRNAVNPSRDSVADTEIGLYGTQTQGEIADDRGSKTGLNSNEEKQGKLSLAEMKQQAMEKQKEEPEKERAQEQEMELD